MKARAGSPRTVRARATLTPFPPARSTVRCGRSVSVGMFRWTNSDLSRQGFRVTVRIISHVRETCYNGARQGSKAMLVTIDQYLDYLRITRRLSPHTVKGYSEDLLQFHNFLTQDDSSCAGWADVDHRRSE